MKKIYLIDDNIDGNQQKYGGAFVEEGKFADVICCMSKLSANDDLSFVNDAACILLHKTFDDFYDGVFHDDSHKVVELIRLAEGIGDTIPFVLFSDGDTSDIGEYRWDKPSIIYSLSKRAFYSRLEDFILHYKTTEQIELRILAFGRDYEKIIIEKLAAAVFARLQEVGNDEVVPVTKIHCQNDMRQIVEMAQPKIGKSYEDIINDLQLNPITVGEFKNRINNIIENFQDYGKNYYTWK